MNIGRLVVMNGGIFLAVLASAGDFWSPWVLNREGGSFKLESRSRESFVITGKRLSRTNRGNTGCIAIGTYNEDYWTSKRLAISARSTNGRKVGVTVSLSFRNGTNVFSRSLPTFDVSGKGWRELSWSLDHDMNLGDGGVKVYQAKIIAWITEWKEGDEGGLEVKNFRICNAADTAQSELWLPDDRFVNVPFREGRAPSRPPVADALKVFFAFDNEDLEPHPIKGWKGEFDLPQCGGFREVMLEGAEGHAVVTPDLDAADVIVYSRTRPDVALASNIVRRVRSGVPLYVAGEVRDPEIEAVLPVKVSHDVLEDLPPRERIVPTDAAPSVFRAGLNDATFGIYRACEAKPGARTLLGFAGGTPAVAEGTCGKGRVVYSMVTVGASLVPGKEAMDAFFLRALGYLTGRALPERERTRAKVDADGWRKGAGKGDFGRFGWNRGSELPVEDFSSRFVVRKGESWYEMHFPREVAGRPRTMTYAARTANQLGFSGDVAIDGKPAYNVSGSIAYPGLRWDIRRPSVEMRMRNQLSCVALQQEDGWRVRDFSQDPSSVDARKMTKNAFLVWNGSFRDSPLLVVCQHRLKALEPIMSGESIEGLRLVSEKGGPLGVVVPTRLYGSKSVDTTAWDRALPADVTSLAAEWSAHALAYPVNLEETFRIDEKNGRVEMRDRFETLTVADDWGTAPRPYAAVPPVAALLAEPTADGKTIFATERDVRDSGLVTRAGNLRFKDGASEVRWSVPLMKPDLGFYPHARGFADADKAANLDFGQAVHYSSGGTRMNDVGQKYGKLPPHHTTCFNMHGYLLGMSRCLPNPYIYDEENRRLMRRRLAWRMLEPLEVFQYKMAVRWRVEPFSGARYTIYMNSPRRMANEFDPPEYGSRTIFGDSNETVRMICHALQVAADRLGQYGVVRANWDAIARQVATYERAIDDWGILCSGCLELGGSGAIDMLNGEYACWMSLARLAEIAGDDDFRAEALYRAARRLCPTLARNRALAYFDRNGLFEEPDRWRASVGFGENGAQFHSKNRRVMDVELFDMSQGTPQDLVSLYGWYGYGEMRRDYFPYVAAAKPGEGLDYITLATLAIGSDLPDAEIRSRLDALVKRTLASKKPWHDWPGMDTGSFIEFTLHRLTGSPKVTDCRDVNVHDAQYDPATGVLTLDVTPGAKAALAVEGKPVALKGTNRQKIEVK